MGIYFYAVDTDFDLVAEFFFRENLQVFEKGSFDKDVRNFGNLAELKMAFRQERRSLGLVGYHPSFGGKLLTEKRDTATGGFYCAMAGWGLLNIQLGKLVQNEISLSYLVHHTEKGAKAKALSLAPRLGSPSDWDWSSISKWSRLFKKYVKEIAKSEMNSKLMLPSAAELAIDSNCKWSEF